MLQVGGNLGIRTPRASAASAASTATPAATLRITVALLLRWLLFRSLACNRLRPGRGLGRPLAMSSTAVARLIGTRAIIRPVAILVPVLIAITVVVFIAVTVAVPVATRAALAALLTMTAVFVAVIARRPPAVALLAPWAAGFRFGTSLCRAICAAQET